MKHLRGLSYQLEEEGSLVGLESSLRVEGYCAGALGNIIL